MSRILGIGLLIAIILGVAYQLRDNDDTAALPATGSVETEPDVYGQNVIFKQLRADGTLHYRMHADTIRQFNSQELTRMTQPRLRLLNPHQPPWDIASNHGYIRKRLAPSGNVEEVVFLREEVKLVQSHQNNGVITMSADSFYIYPHREYAETDQDVTIDTNVGRTKAAGLKADLATGLIRLSSNTRQRVHTIVLPEQFKKT
jgi:lipopolysaccharide export system protein LptC